MSDGAKGGGGWLRAEQADLASDKILDAAGEAFVELGVSRTGMGDIARFAGCSRGTLYRYFANRHELHLAFVNRTAAVLADRVANATRGIDDPSERIVESILRSIREVRDTPAAAAWFRTGDSGMAADVSRRSELVESLTGAFVASLLGERENAASQLRARFLVRVIVSLLGSPAASEDEEREMVTRFVAPGLLADLAATPRSD